MDSQAIAGLWRPYSDRIATRWRLDGETVAFRTPYSTKTPPTPQGGAVR